MIERSFTDLLEKIVDNRGRTCPTADSGLPLIATNCIKDDRLYPVFENVRYVDEETVGTWFRGHPQPNDIIFVCKGSPGRVAMVPDPVPFCIAQDMVALRADQRLIQPRYLYYALKSPAVQAKINNMHVGSMIPHFKKGDFGKLRFSIHEDMGEQQAIAEVLGALDDKIAANMTLAETAEALIHARWVELIQGMENDVEWLSIDSCGKVVTGKTPPTSVASNYGGETPFVTVGDMRNGFFVSKTQRTLSEQGVAAVKGALLPSGSILMSCIATVGEVAITSGPSVTNQQINALIPNQALHPSFTLISFRALGQELKGMGSGGSVYTNVSKSKFAGMRIPVPPYEAQTQVVSELDQASYCARRASDVLATIRDALLPQLMSGNLLVKNAEKVLEGAGV